MNLQPSSQLLQWSSFDDFPDDFTGKGLFFRPNENYLGTRLIGITTIMNDDLSFGIELALDANYRFGLVQTSAGFDSRAMRFQNVSL